MRNKNKKHSFLRFLRCKSKTHLVNVLSWREQHRWLSQVLHMVELGTVASRMVQLVHLLPARGGHLPLSSATFLISRFALGTL